MSWSIPSSPAALQSIIRVSQLDASLLELELISLLSEKLNAVFALMKTTHQNWKDEISVFLKACLFSMTIAKGKPPYSYQLLNLKYRDESRSKYFDVPLSLKQKFGYVLFTIIVPYLYKKVSTIIYSHGIQGSEEEKGWLRKLKLYIKLGEALYDGCSVVNFLIFIANGRYSTLVDRILRMRLVYERPGQQRNISYEYQHPQLLWHGLTEFLLFILPLIKPQKLKSILKRKLVDFNLFHPKPLSYDDVPSSCCGICHHPLCTPYKTSCGCMYCYYCIQTVLLEDSSWMCLRCCQTVEDIEPCKAL